VNNLIPMSEDEKVTRDILLLERPFAVIQVADSKNLKRTLMITLQLSEMGLPLVLDLNMEDEAMDRGVQIDKERLRELLGIDVVGTVAPRRKGVKELKECILRAAIPKIKVVYDNLIEEYIEKISSLLPESGVSKRAIALMILAGDESLRSWLKLKLSDEVIEEIERLRDECQAHYPKPLGLIIHETRYRYVKSITDEVLTKVQASRGRLGLFLERVSMDPIWGLPVFLAVLYLLYEFVGVFGAGTLVDFFEKVIFGRYLNPMVIKLVDVLLPVPFLRDMLVGEYGVVTVALTYSIAIVLPITATFFIAFSILEDSGYLPRLAIMSNRIFNLIGLNGKAISAHDTRSWMRDNGGYDHENTGNEAGQDNCHISSCPGRSLLSSTWRDSWNVRRPFTQSYHNLGRCGFRCLVCFRVSCIKGCAGRENGILS